MRKLLLLLTAATLTLSAQNGKTQLKVGDKAPDFELKGSDNKSYTLSQFKGNKNVVMAFFPMAFTGG